MAKKIEVTQNSTDDEIRAALKKKGIECSDAWKRDVLIYYAEQQKIYRQIKASLVRDSFKARYGASQNCGDEFAELLSELDIKQVAKDNGISLYKWRGKNPGMIRMNVGNVLRGRVRRGEYVILGEMEYNTNAKVA